MIKKILQISVSEIPTAANSWYVLVYVFAVYATGGRWLL